MAQSILVKDYTGNFGFLQTSEKKTVTIAINEDITEAIDVAGYNEIAVIMPAAWTTATLGLESSATEDGTYTPVYDGTDLVSETVAVDRTVILSKNIGPLLFIKLKSSASQDAARTLTVLLSR